MNCVWTCCLKWGSRLRIRNQHHYSRIQTIFKRNCVCNCCLKCRMRLERRDLHYENAGYRLETEQTSDTISTGSFHSVENTDSQNSSISAFISNIQMQRLGANQVFPMEEYPRASPSNTISSSSHADVANFGNDIQ